MLPTINIEMRMKICKTCRNEKPITEFHSSGYSYKKDGTKTQVFKPECKKCFNDRRNRQITERLDALVPEWKCSVCGYDKCKAALDFHHTDPKQKDFVIAAARTTSFERLRQEIEKCILLCANCHRELHDKDLGE